MKDESGTDRVMVDIETLGLKPGASIISIGAVRFDAGEGGDRFRASISLTSCEEAGLTIDAETLEWWLTQDERANRQLVGGDPLAEVLEDFSEWYGDADEIWANSPSFDCELLSAAYDAVGLDEPWDFWSERDFRTLKSFELAPEPEQSGVEHDALDDAVHQAEIAAETLARINEGELVTDGGQRDGEVSQLKAHCYYSRCDKTFESVDEMVPVAGKGDRSPRHFCEDCAERVRRGPPLTDGGQSADAVDRGGAGQ